MLISDLFEKDVTRTIPPVVYFHEQSPAKLKDEVDEYIITGGYESNDPRAAEDGIHEQFVRLLTGLRQHLDGSADPACWISGFFGSGKSSFAKLLGLALDGAKLPGGKPLADALLAQDRSPHRDDFEKAWHALVDTVQPIGLVFDVGAKAREDEHIHAVVVRQLQERMNYSATSNLVAEYELKLELEGLHDAFVEKFKEVHKRPWSELKDSQLVEDYFSAALHALRPALFPTPMSWVDSRTGSQFGSKRAADEAVVAIDQILKRRAPGRTLFIVVDEVSQYIHDDEDRMLALQSFVVALKARMKGQVWLLATGQQKLEEGAGNIATLSKMKDRFPPSLRVHLGTANIRDVVHKRLLRKKKQLERDLTELFHAHRSDLSLYAYQGHDVKEMDFVEVYPMLPGHIDLLMQITTGLRSKSSRVQGDSHAIRGLLQLLGDLFREQDLVRREPGYLITIDRVYDVLHTALSTDVQATLTRAFEFAANKNDELMRRVVKAVAMLQQVQDDKKETTAELISRCLYERLGQGNQLPAVQAALDALVGENLLAYSEKGGYKVQSTAGQEWQNERDNYAPGPEQKSAKVLEALEWLMGDVDKPKLGDVGITWRAFYSDGYGQKDARVKDERKYTVVTVDFQLSKKRSGEHWIPISSQGFTDRIFWVVGDADGPMDAATQLIRSERMVERYGSRQSSLGDERAHLLIDERNRVDHAKARLQEAVKSAFMAGQFYFQGRKASPTELGASFAQALTAYGNRIVPLLYPHPVTFSVSEKDIVYLIDNTELAAPPAVFGQDRLGLLTLDAGRYEVTCHGRVPKDVLAYVTANPGVTGSTLLAHFGAPPHGVPPDVLKAVVVGLLRGAKVRIQVPGGSELTSVRDEGVRELLKETGLRKAELLPNTKEALDPRDRSAICKLFSEHFGAEIARENEAIADAVVKHFKGARERLTQVGASFRRLPSGIRYPKALEQLEKALEVCRASRQVEPVAKAVKAHLPALQDGLSLLRRVENDLSDDAIATLRLAYDTQQLLWPELEPLASAEARKALSAIDAHLHAERPWEDLGDLKPHVQSLRDGYKQLRQSILTAQGAKLDAAIEQVKRRDGFDRLNPDQSHQVISHLREGAPLQTTAEQLVPPLRLLDDMFAARLESASHKAQTQLDELLETLGESPTVEVDLELRGRLVRSVTELDRVLAEIRDRIVRELAANHRVRLK
ncbi:MAG TPA: BREX system P-loop protein BrxC [Polyangiaceae bacterium]|nr:BREX system P-loop protein BrxC [Polyangiaceae bacterium]